jgi:hypothetical protein
MSIIENSLQLIGETLDVNSSKFIKKLNEEDFSISNIRKLCISL